MQERQPKLGSRRAQCGQAGFTLIELMIAMAVLGVGMSAVMVMIVLGMETNSRNKTDTTATVLDQEIIEKFSTLKNYPAPTFVNIYDCALNAGNANQHEANLAQAVAPGAGATLFTAATAPTPGQIGDIDWTAATPVLATSAAAGYAMNYQTCSGEMYQVRWNIMDLAPAGTNSRLSLLTVSARPLTAVTVGAAGANRGALFGWPVTLRALIEN
jgi:prepilin-type N-terminal cleavage/methylation domain-containing protein